MIMGNDGFWCWLLKGRVLRIIKKALNRGQQHMEDSGSFYGARIYPTVDEDENFIKLPQAINSDVGKIKDKIIKLENYLNIEMSEKEYKKRRTS